MSFSKTQDILPFLIKPSRYIGGETNSINKNRRLPLSIALCFPDAYEIGTSHFGIQILYHILNQQDWISAERVFAPGRDLEQYLRNSKLSLVSLESKKPLKEFDIIGFSLLYELNYTNLMNMLNLSGIPLYANQRENDQPLIIAGGPCTFNPEPVAEFFDAMVIGDGEEVIIKMAEGWIDCKNRGWTAGRKNAPKADKAAVLKKWSDLQGVYIPSYYIVNKEKNGQASPRPGSYAPEKVLRAFLPELTASFFPDKPVVPFGKPIHDRLRLEIARGCSRGCRFCQAGMIYRPVRERTTRETLELAEKSLCATGYDDLSLLSLSTGDYSDLNSLIEELMCRYGKKHIALSIPSFRAGSLNEQAMKQIRQVRKTGFTIAPEAGSQDLRNLINKNITEEEIIETVNRAFDAGWNLIKAYFMIGLPEETDADVEAIVRLVKKILEVSKKKGRQKKINVSVATFVPKAHTPFQWESQIPLQQAADKIFRLKRMLSAKEIGFKWQQPQVSLLEGVFSRGDRALSRLLENAFLSGCRFDGWSDDFDFDKWRRAAEESEIDFDSYTVRARSIEEPLPWDHISCGVTRDFLIKERKNGRDRKLTTDCRDHPCLQCGVCDFESIFPRLAVPLQAEPCRSEPATTGSEQEEKTEPKSTMEKSEKMVLVYSKMGPARYFGHLEFMNIFIRALSRAGIPLVYSKGFHPKPRLAFGDPLPVGIESEEETACITVADPLNPEQVVSSLNRHLPDGITIRECRTVAGKELKKGTAGSGGVFYTISLMSGIFDREKASAFSAAESFFLNRTDHKHGFQQINIKDLVKQIIVLDEKTTTLELEVLPGKRVRPGEVVAAIFGLPEEVVVQSRIVKKATRPVREC